MILLLSYNLIPTLTVYLENDYRSIYLDYALDYFFTLNADLIGFDIAPSTP